MRIDLKFNKRPSETRNHEQVCEASLFACQDAKHYYSLLGFADPSKATPEDIKKQYKAMALKNHPDKGGSTFVFQLLNDAFAVLSELVAETNLQAKCL